jgi:VWFA-related protein
VSVLAASGVLLVTATAIAQQPVHEQISVERVEVTLHVTDRRGEPIRGLSPSDFRVFVDRRPVRIESLEWVSNGPQTASGVEESGREPPSCDGAEAVSPPMPPGRLIVLLFQWEVAGQKQEGFVRMVRQALDFVDSLEPRDRLAVLTLGARLWLLQDFTEDRDKARIAIRNALGHGVSDRPAAGEQFSLRAGLSSDAQREATSIEKALLAIGRGLKPIPGSKAVLFFGWGIGKWLSLRSDDPNLGAVVYSKEYEQARAALSEAQAPVFTLDISDGRHQLEEGLKRLSFETGGCYVPTYLFPEWAMKTVAHSISGHYVLVFRKPDGAPGSHSIRVETSRREVVLLYRQQFED